MKLDDARMLHQRKYREELRHFLVEGEHPLLELQKAARLNPALRGCVLYVTREHAQWRSPFDTHVITSAQMAKLAETKTPQGLVAVVPMLPVPAPRPGERAVYLHEARDPGNLGTILRTLAWFGKLRCLLSPGSVDLYNGKVVRASMGALFQVAVEVDVELSSLPERFPRLARVEMRGEPVFSPGFKDFDCYLFGSEARGLPAEAAALVARSFSIPGCGGTESLNLASAVNICAYELNRT